ncbi:MAG: S8 family serine peptidase, partial [Pseudoflavonifractor sp.]
MKKRILCCILAAVLSFPGAFSPAAHAAPPPEAAEFDGYLVRLSDARQESPMRLRSMSAEPVSEGLCLVQDLSTAEALVSSGMAEDYEPNYILTLQDATYTPTQWNLLAVNAKTAWDHKSAETVPDMLGDGITVAVIDSGIMATHEDFNAENLLPCNNLSGAPNGMNGWHGTFVAGVIAAQVNNSTGDDGKKTDGVTPNVKLLPICVMNGETTTVTRLIQAIDAAIAAKVDVMNLSVGGKNSSTYLAAACQRAVDAGIVVVAAAGNYRSGDTKSSSTYMYPASYDGVVSVSACKQGQSTPEFDQAYSYFNDKVTVAAPGSSVESLYTDGKTAVRDGTSFSAPVVSAMAAMAKQRNKSISPATFQTLLCASATDLGTVGKDNYYGAGLVDIEAFAALLDQSYTITYSSGAGSAVFPPEVVAPANYNIASPEIALPAPVQEGSTFLGWYEDPAFAGSPVTAIPTASMGDRVYYARWEKIPPPALTGNLTLTNVGPVSSGDTLTLAEGSLINNSPVIADSADYGLAWLRDDKPIGAATGLSYLVTAADRGHALSLTAPRPMPNATSSQLLFLLPIKKLSLLARRA